MQEPAGRAARPPPTKTIVVYKNGDAFFTGKKRVLNPRHLSTFDNFLTSLTEELAAPFGAVRRLHTPAEGHRVHGLDDLKHRGVYVAVPRRKSCFQSSMLGSLVVTRHHHHQFSIPLLLKADFFLSSFFFVDSHSVFINGDLLVDPVRIRIPKYTLRSWESVLAMVTEKVRLRTGAVYRLCTVDGRPVSDLAELQNNRYYVAVGAKKFQHLPYVQVGCSLPSGCLLPPPLPVYRCKHLGCIIVVKRIFEHTAFQLTFPTCETCCGSAFRYETARSSITVCGRH
uniref:Si:dkey-25g12.4 n=1 Tax=Gasterosteus aculeatus aculeatus TaxID=481459 RepID=G3P2Y5_GASAC